jgi:hypothetical protein
VCTIPISCCSQAAIASDVSGRSFATLCFDNLMWTVVDETDDVKLYPPTVVGFNLGDGITAINVTAPFINERTPPWASMSCGGSAGPTGCYTWRVDGVNITAPSASQTPSMTRTQTSSPTMTATSTATSSQMRTPTSTSSPTNTVTSTTSPSGTSTGTLSPTSTATLSQTSTGTLSPYTPSSSFQGLPSSSSSPTPSPIPNAIVSCSSFAALVSALPASVFAVPFI